MNCRTGRLAACALALSMVSAQAEELKKVMLVSEALGYKHKEALTIGADAIALGGRANKWFATTHAKIADLTNAQAVAAFDAIVLNNTTDLECEKYPGLESVLTNFVASGKGIVFLHAAVDAFYKSPAIQEMSGGLFSGHPWYFEGTWKFRNEAPGSELNRSFGGVETFWASDEIYQQKSPPFDRKTCKVLVSLVADEPDNRKAEENWRNHKLERIRRDFPIRADRDFAVSWKRAYGKGRVFYTSFGHDRRAFMDPARFGHIMAGIRYAAGDPDITLGATPSAAALTEAREFASSDGGVFRYRWHQPPKFEPGKTYPMLVYMHGAGSRGTNNVGHLYWAAPLVFDLEKRFGKDYFFLAGQVPKGKRWVEVDWSSTAHKMPTEPSETMGRQIEFLEKAFRELPIDRSRVYVTGLSMGGYGTWDLICRKPEWFAAAIPVCGGGDVRMAERLRDLPIWAYHGDLDTTVPTVRSRNMVRAIWEAGGNVRYSELPEVAHCSWIQAYGNEKTLDWLYSQRNSSGKGFETRRLD